MTARAAHAGLAIVGGGPLDRYGTRWTVAANVVTDAARRALFGTGSQARGRPRSDDCGVYTRANYLRTLEQYATG